MPFGGANNTPVDVDALPTNESGIVNAEESLADQIAKMFADGDGDGALGNGVGSTAPTIGESGGGDEGEQAPEGVPTAPPAPTQSTEPAGAPEAPEETPEPGAPATTPDTESPLDLIEFNGRKLTRAQANGLLSVYEWAVANPQQAALVDAYMQGQAEIVLPGQAQQSQQAPTQQTPESQPTQSVDPYAGLSPELADRLRAMETVVKYTAEERDRDQAARLRTQQETDSNIINNTLGEFQKKYALTDQQRDEIAGIAAAAQILPGIRAASPDLRSAVLTALDMTFWATPQYRTAELNRQAESIANQSKKQAAQSTLIGARGGVGSTPKAVDSPRPVPKDKDERNRLMAADIARELSGSTN